MTHTFSRAFTRFFLVCFIWQTLSPSILLAAADVSFDVHKESGSHRLFLTLKEKDQFIVDNFDLLTLKGEKNFGSTCVEHDTENKRFLVHYNNRTSGARMGVIVTENGDMELRNSMDASAVYSSDEEIEFYESASTLNDRQWTWSFKTSGTLTNTANLLFHIIYTHARAFHNYGVIKALTGNMCQNYQFNAGVFDFGDALTPIHEAAYMGPLHIVASSNPDAKPQFAEKTVDDYGLFLSAYGHIIRGLTYKAKGIYLNQGDVVLDQSSFVSSPCRMPFNMDCISSLHGCWIAGQFQGDASLIEVERDVVVGGFDPSMHVGTLLTHQGAYLSIVVDDWNGEEGFRQISVPFERLRNQGEIDCCGIMRFKMPRFPSDLGKMSAIGVGFDLLRDADAGSLFEAPPQRVPGKVRTLLKQRKYLEYYLHTTTRHLLNGRHTHNTETGPVFQYRVLIGEQDVVREEDSTQDLSLETLLAQRKNQRSVLEQVKESIRKNLYKLAAAGSKKNDLLYGLMQAMAASGLSGELIEEILTDPEIESLIEGISSWDGADERERGLLEDKGTDSGFALSQMVGQARSTGGNVFNWVIQNPGYFMDILCATAATGRAVAPSNTVVRGLNALCGMRVAYARASSVKFGDVARGCLAQTEQRTRLTHFFRDIQNSGKGLQRGPKSGEVSSGGVEKVREVKPRGMHNSVVREAAQKGRQAHKEIIGQYQHKEGIGWRFEQRIQDKKKDKHYRPDILTPDGKPIELKPYTPSGISQGQRQITKYKQALKKNGRVIYYDPNTGRLIQ